MNRSQTKPAGRLWRRTHHGATENGRKPKGRQEVAYRLPIVVPLLTVERPRETPEGGEGRKLWCRRYDRCLTFAAAKGWTGFACDQCPVNDEVSEDERLVEAARVKRFIAEAKP